MSLDVCLTNDAGEEVFSANITHNLGRMAREAGLYRALWRMEPREGLRADDLRKGLTRGVVEMIEDPDRFRSLDAPNGWGTYDQFLPWLVNLIAACKRHPDARFSSNG